MKKNILMITITLIISIIFIYLFKPNIEKEEFNNNAVYKTYEDGKIVYFNPNKNQICKEEEALIGKSKSGCMKWYIFMDNKYKNKVTVILDHNTTPRVSYNAGGNNSSMKEVLQALANDTKTWDKEIIKSARLITADEVAKIVGNDSWNSKNEKSDIFYFGSLDKTDYNSMNEEQKKRQNSFAWLFDWTNRCIDFGCTQDDISTFGYWTSSAKVTSDRTAWNVDRMGRLINDAIDLGENSIGLRPVIEIDKSLLD